MKHRTIWLAAFTTAILSWTSVMTSAVARQQEPQVLISGLNVERTLGPGENHIYTITLQEGAAITGKADQHGVDLMIDIFDPDGKKVTTVDSPNGTEGPESFDLTAFKTGMYKLIIRASDATAKPGKYVMKVDRILTVDENGQRMAERNYPPALQKLWRLYLTDTKAVENFVASRKGKGPIIEDLGDSNKNSRVTYIYYGGENTEAVRVAGGPNAAVGGILMRRFLHTLLFFAVEIVPNDARFRYNFAAIETRFIGPAGAIKVSEDVFTPIDPLNPDSFGDLSVLTMPAAPAQPYIVKNDSVPQGKLTPASIKSAALKEDRNLTIYTPSGYDGTKDCELLIVFDGVTYGGGSDALVPTPTILDNLIAANKINPTITVLVPTMGKRARDLTDYPPFAEFIGAELVPWARQNYRINAGAGHVVVAGSSLGGLSASYCAFRHPEAIGNVLSQSGSYWVTKSGQTRSPYPYADETGELINEFKKSERLPIKFYLEVGRFDSAVFMMPTNREFRDVLQVKGYQVTYNEFDSGHDYIWWRGSLADGLIALIGKS